jgi:hypothetical protein
MALLECILINWGITITLAILLAISELLDDIPSIKANSVHKFVINFLRVVTSTKKNEKEID